MAMHDDTESCSSSSSRAVMDSHNPRSRNHQQRHRNHVFNRVLRKLQDAGFLEATLPAFHTRLSLHFNRLPVRYALDVNVERAEDVVMHMKLLRQAQDDPDNTLAYEVRLVQLQVNPATIGHVGDSVHSCYSTDEVNEGSVRNSCHLGLHPPPTFGSLQNLDTLGLQANVEDRESCVKGTTSHTLRPMHEITLSTVDKPKLLSQLTSLLSDMCLNIQEAHAFSTVDGFSLDVFVVDGWPHEETEQLRNLLDKEIRKIKPSQPKGISSEAVGGLNHQSFECSHKKVEMTAGIDKDVDIDLSVLKLGFKVGSGTYSDLYRGTYCDQKVAIKILKPAAVNESVQKEFLQEVNIMRKVRHKNVVQFIGACTKPPMLCIVTEFMPKGNLYDFMHEKKGTFKLQALVRTAIDISMGMEYLHQNGIIHRDLKTANLLINEDGVIKVADFGVAREQTHSGEMTAETGTYRWMAPEIIGHKPYNHKADVYSFGIVLWELLTGELPYSHLTPLQAAIGVVQTGLRPSIPKHTHPRLADLVYKCWHQDPNVRPDFSEIIETLQQIGTKKRKKMGADKRNRPSADISAAAHSHQTVKFLLVHSAYHQ